MRRARPFRPAAPKILSLDKALDALRAGAVLVELHLPATEGGTSFYVAGRAGGRVTAVTVKAILERPDVQPGGDGLFPGVSQTFRLGGD